MPFIGKKRDSKGQFVRTFYISKPKLLKLYNKHNRITKDICRVLGISYIQLYKLFKAYNIKLEGKRRIITYCCKICGNRISNTSALHGKGTCNFCANLKENNPNYIDGRTKEAKYYCKICNKEISISAFKYGCCRCRVCFVRVTFNNSKKYKYKSNSFRSSWEVSFAKWLDLSDINYEYENKVFELGNKAYLPDFYLPEFDCYIEIKGWFRKKAKDKMKLFKSLYPNINIRIFFKKELDMLGVL